MPEFATDEDTKVRKESLKCMAYPMCESSASYASCPNCPGRNRTPLLHADHCSSDSIMLYESGVELEVKAAAVLMATPENQDFGTTSSCNSRHQCEVGSMSTQRGLKEKFCEEAPSTSNTVSDAADPFVSNSLSDIAMHPSNSRKRVRYTQSEAQFQHKELKKFEEPPEESDTLKARLVCHQLCTGRSVTYDDEISCVLSFSIDLSESGGVRSVMEGCYRSER